MDDKEVEKQIFDLLVEAQGSTRPEHHPNILTYKIVSIARREKTACLTLYPKYPSSDHPDELKYEICFGEIRKRIGELERKGYNPTQIELRFRVEDNAQLYGLPVTYKFINSEGV